MTHAKMLKTRRRKQKGKKVLARLAKLEKKSKKQNMKMAGENAPKEGRP